jgi:hypothetical protein
MTKGDSVAVNSEEIRNESLIPLIKNRTVSKAKGG